MSDPIGSYSTAKAYVQSAFLIVTNPLRLQLENDTSFILSYHLLIGFATELYLKAYLMKKGHQEVDLKKKGLGHNLEELLNLAERHGMQNWSARRIVAYLNEHHSTFGYRYVAESSLYTFREPQIDFEQLSELDRFVDGVTGASASRGVDHADGKWALPADWIGWRLHRAT